MAGTTISSASAARNVLNISYLRGVDLHNSPSNVDASRSPDAPNMIRDVPGKVRKRMGYQTMASVEGRVNGAFQVDTNEVKKRIIHAGTKLYLLEGAEVSLLYDGMADHRSVGQQIGGKLYLLDGSHFLRYGEGGGAAGERGFREGLEGGQRKGQRLCPYSHHRAEPIRRGDGL